MKMMSKLRLATLALFSISSVFASKTPNIFYKNGDFEAAFVGKIETETASDINGNLFNSHVNDKLVANKTKIDLSMTTQGQAARSKITMRNKVVWGNHKVISTDEAYLLNLNVEPSAHSHKIGPNMVWIREAWVETDMTKVCKMANFPKQTFTIGAFSFSLGRGIALGDAYGVTPASMGFFQDSTVDQYAWGAKLSGDLIQSFMNYDLYLSILSNKSTSITETNFPSQARTFGGDNSSIVRGAGKISYVFAAHSFITPLNSDETKLSMEPYLMHHYDPEQRLEAIGDTKANLTTAGFAVEFTASRFEFGFDCASNFGHQFVRGLDRNVPKVTNTAGYATYTYSDVYNVDPNIATPTAANAVFYDPSNTSQTTAISSVTAGGVSNGKVIANTTPALYNSLTRYRNPYTTKFRGYMWVGDASFWMIPKNLVASLTWGFASGDQNPNVNLADPNDSSVDGNYNGFIPFQEIYAGKRVQSFYCMTSMVTRPLDLSTSASSSKSYAPTASNFTNLIFWGCGVKYAPEFAKRKWNVNPNFLMYWQNVASNTFDITKGQTTGTPASKYVGSEVNVFFRTSLSDEVYVSGGAALFVPGTFYFDIKGKPTSSSQRSALNAALKAGTDLTTVPLISNNSAYSVSMAMGYMF